jgi:ABC-2 type transport system ATP-binding protein
VGTVIAEGTADELKARVGGEVLELRVADPAELARAGGSVLALGPGGAQIDNEAGRITIPVGTDGPGILTEAVRRLDDEKVQLSDVGLRRPTLEDVFLALTGHAAEPSDERDGESAGLGRGAAPEERGP